MASATGFEVKGLSESIKLLGKVDKELRKEAGLVVRKAAKQLQTESRARMKTAPGVRRSGYPLPMGAITRRSTATKGTIGINTARYPIVGPAEWGWSAQFIPYRGKGNGGRFVPQHSMKRRTFPIARTGRFKFPKYAQRLAALSGPGWVVQPVLRQRLGMVQKQINDDMFAVFAASARKAGVPRG